jgi:large conductance mechanosensitive channel
LTARQAEANNQTSKITQESRMGMVQEFKEFAVKGNAMDLAVGVIIGGAFGKIVDSIVGDLIMPLVSRVVGKLDFSNLFFVLGDNPNNLAALADLKKAGIPVFAYGAFLTVVVNFIILAFIIFMMVKQLNRLRSEEPAAVQEEAPATPEDVLLLREIRDSLKK